MRLAVQDQGNHGAEPGFAGRHRCLQTDFTSHGGVGQSDGHIGEQPVHVGVEVVVRAAVAGGIDTGPTAQDINFQSGVIGEAVGMEPVENVLGFFQGIGPEGRTGFGNFFGQPFVGGRDEGET